MPFTPYHFGPSAAVGLPLEKYIDVPVFVLVNVAVDIEPLLVIVFGLDYPLHGYCHTLLFGSMVGAACGCIIYLFRGFIRGAMKVLRLRYKTSLLKVVVSGILGAWLHITLDSIMHRDVMPFWPSSFSPLYQLVSTRKLYMICSVCFIPAVVIYLFKAGETYYRGRD